MKILVTGGAGFIGSHLVDIIIQKSIGEVIILDNLYRGNLNNISHLIKKKEITFVKGDIRDTSLVSNITKNVDLIFHLAAQSNVMGSISDIDYGFSTNVVGTYNIFKSSSQNNVNKIVFTSSREIYGEAQYLPVDEKHPILPKSPYGASKASGEVYANAFRNTYGLNITCARLANVYGTRDTGRVIPLFFEKLQKNDDLIIYGGQQILDFVYIDDVVNALIQLSSKNINEINIGSGKGITINELADIMINLKNKKCKKIINESRPVEVNKFVANIEKMKNSLGITPINIEEGLKLFDGETQ